MYWYRLSGVVLVWLAAALGLPAVRAGVSAPARLGTPAAAAPSVLAAPVPADLETDPVPNAGDAADDPAIWLHPTDPLRSTIIGADKLGGIGVYDVDGRELQYRRDGNITNIDLRYDFPLNGQRITLVAAGNKTGGSHIVTYRVDPETGLLEDIAARTIDVGFSVYGGCMYRSPTSGKYYMFVTSDTGAVEQWELFATAAGTVDGREVRSFQVGSSTEGCVADDAHAALYIAEEDVAIWRYGAEPDDDTGRRNVDRIDRGRLEADIEGLAIYAGPRGSGYLLVSNQGDHSYALYERSGRNAYVASFTIAANNDVDAVSSTDGIDVTHAPFGARFPNGVFVAHDGRNDGNSNFKLVGWDKIVTAALATVTPINRVVFADADARVEQAEAAENFGTSTTLRADGGGDPGIESYLRFRIKNLRGTVQRATLRVYASSSTDNGPAVYHSATTWTEDDITWDTRPARSRQALDDRSTTRSSSWVEYDVTSSVTGNGTYSFVLATDTANGVTLSSRQGSSPPQLVITVQ